MVASVVVLFLFALLPTVKAFAINRTATISAPSEAYLGQTFTVTLGFSNRELTRGSDFRISYDNNLIQMVSISNVSGLSSDVQHGSQSPLSMTFIYMGDAKSADKIFSLKFKVIAKGSVSIKIEDASDGIIEPENSISTGASRTITLSDPPPTTTTAPKTTTTTTPKETQPRHPGETVIGKRYDGVELSVPVSLPEDEIIPNSYVPAEIEWQGKYLEGYRSETLPYTLYWLTDRQGENRFYLYDTDISVFVPYLRTGWSSRFYTFSVIPGEMIPQGFELTTVSVWEKDVPAYKPVEGSFVSKTVYDQLFHLSEPRLEPEELSDEAKLLPGDLYLIAVRVNDAEEKVLCLYDAVLDSLIRSDLWLVPVSGSFLDPAYQSPATDPTDTEPDLPSDTEPVETEPWGTEDSAGGLTVNLFGVELPLYLVVGTGLVVLLMLALAVWFFIRAKRAADFEPGLTVADLDGDDSPLPEFDEEVMPLVAQEEEELSEDLGTETGPQADPEDGWQELKETLFGREEKEDRRPDKRPPGIRPSIHRRAERDDPEDVDEL